MQGASKGGGAFLEGAVAHAERLTAALSDKAAAIGRPGSDALGGAGEHLHKARALNPRDSGWRSSLL